MKAEAAVCPGCGNALPKGAVVCAVCLLDAALLPDQGEASEPLVYANNAPASEQRFGAYDLLEVIARGGMGIIYRARQRESKRVVALKMILPQQLDDTTGTERFKAEARAASGLEHPNIVPLYDVGEHDGLPFFAMKFAEGGALAGCEKYRGKYREIAEMIAKVARALHHAHQRGVLHRDVKPGNILLDGAGEPMLSDFGIAKALAEGMDLTRTLAVLGTPAYLSPEQAAGKTKELTVAADIYGLGAVLYELLASRAPFSGENAMAVLRKVETERPAPPSQFDLDVPRDLEIICLKCLAKEPRDRYASADLFADDLQRWLDDRTILARTATPPEGSGAGRGAIRWSLSFPPRSSLCFSPWRSARASPRCG